MAAKFDDYDLAPDFPQGELIEKFEQDNYKVSQYFKIKKFRFALSKQQREDLLDCAAASSRTHELMIYTQMHTGLRVGELVNLPIDAVHFGEKVIIVNTHQADDRITYWHPKTVAGSRIVFPPEKLFTKLSGYIRDEKRKYGYFFISQKKSAFRKETVIAFINKYASEAKSIGHNIGSHAMRRTFATFLIDNHAPIGKISKMLGHASIEITLKYLFQIDDMEGYSEIRKMLDKMVDY
jgi:integrase